MLEYTFISLADVLFNFVTNTMLFIANACSRWQTQTPHKPQPTTSTYLDFIASLSLDVQYSSPEPLDRGALACIRPACCCRPPPDSKPRLYLSLAGQDFCLSLDVGPWPPFVSCGLSLLRSWHAFSQPRFVTGSSSPASSPYQISYQCLECLFYPQWFA